MPDKRVHHFWDLWRFGTRTYSEQLGIPAREAWDMTVIYEPQVVWQEKGPEPAVWFQNRELRVGKPYSKDALEAEIKKWLK
jgi:hypothetical protein